MATPMDALYFREQYGRQLRRPERGAAQAFRVAPITNEMTTDEVRRMVDQVRRSLIRSVDYGDVHYVSAEMTEYLKGVMAEHLQGERTFHLEQGDLPSLTGFVYFDGSIPVPTVYSPTGFQNLRAILWDQYAISREDGPPVAYHGGVEDMRTPRNPPPEVIGKILYTVVETAREDQREVLGPWSTRHWVPAPWGQRFTPAVMVAKAFTLDDSKYRDNLLTDEQWEQDDRDTITSFDVLYKLITVWTRVIRTEIPVQHPRSAAYDKIMHKEGRPPADVKVTLLRKYAKTPPHGMAEVDWAYRWEVKGHYRWQRVGPGRQFVRQVWVSKHVKGPPDKPLVVRDSVTALVR